MSRQSVTFSSLSFSGIIGLGAVLLAALVSGCGGKVAPASSAEAEHISKVAKLIGEFHNANASNNPKNIDELKAWAVKNGKAEEQDFVSTRDHQPYVIEPMAMMRMQGMDMGPMAAKMPVILHEAEGKNGLKFVVQNGVCTEMESSGLDYMTKGRSGINTKGEK